MKKILIALDYNPTAQKVAEEGFALAKAMGAGVVLLHVLSEPVYYSSTVYSPIMGFGGYTDMDFLQPNIIDELIIASQHFLDESKKYLGDTSIETLVKSGDTADAILDAGKEIKADIIVIGSHSRKWLEAIVLGSVAEKVLKHSSIPLYIIPTRSK
jgi:nucleotide-binding universal stress UspA family protein